MKRGDRSRLAHELEKQGGTVRITRSGFIAKHPTTKGTVSWHSANTSDSRGVKNLRTDIRGAGFIWPFSTVR